MSGTVPALVFRLWSLENRRKPFLTLTIFDLLDVTELNEAEVIDVAANDGVFLCLCCSIELSEAVWIDGEALEGSGRIGSEGSALMRRAETLLMTRLSVVSGS